MKILPALPLFFLLCGCVSAPHDPSLPAGAVPLAEGGYMMPLGKDADGCPQYQKHDPGKLTTQVIQYRKKDGSFTMEKYEADCRA